MIASLVRMANLPEPMVMNLLSMEVQHLREELERSRMKREDERAHVERATGAIIEEVSYLQSFLYQRYPRDSDLFGNS